MCSLRELERLEFQSLLGTLLHWKNKLTNIGKDSSLGVAIDLRAYPHDTIYNLSAVKLDRGASVVANKVLLGFNTERYPPGSWEWAAASVYMDAHYQFSSISLQL